MATNEQLIPIPGRLHSLASEGHVAGADEIYDDTQGKLQSTINTEKADKSATVSDVSYDTTNKKIQQTINGTTTDVVSVSTLKTDMSLQKSDVGLGNVENKSSATIRGELTSSNVTTALGYTPPQQDTTYSVMGASGSTHASGLVPDTPTIAGTTKFLREDGTWQEVNAAPEVQIGGSTPSSESEIKLFVDESADDTVEVYTKAQADGQFVAVVNMNTEPTESTLTYTSIDGTTKNFKVGDEVRVPDAEADNEYTFYKLYKLETVSSVTTATWDKLGAGGSAPVNPNETVNISLTQVGGNSADLTGASITITDDDSGDTLLDTTWNGSTITTEIDVNTHYTVSVSTITGYLSCADQSYQAGYQTERSVSFQYRGNGVFIEATDGILYTSSSWAAAEKTANAVVLITASYKARICIIQPTSSMSLNPVSETTYSMTAITAENTAKGDTDGINNTQKILAKDGSTSDAAGYCNNYTFPDNNTKGYLPAQGELWLAYQNKTNINACLTACNGDAFINNVIWSSTYYGSRSGSYMGFWRVNFSDGSCDAAIQSWGAYVRVFASYQ